MGNLLMCPEGFHFQDSPQSKVVALGNFLKAGNWARLQGDSTYFSSRLVGFGFSWGDFHVDFFYATWDRVQSGQLAWIPQTLFQVLAPFRYANPSGMGLMYTDLGDLDRHRPLELNGLLGCATQLPPARYVSCVPTWHEWHQNYYRQFPERFAWKPHFDPFLPNKSFTEQILRAEIETHNQMDKLPTRNSNITLTFHDFVMRTKGPTLSAYTQDIGRRVLEANFYNYDQELSMAESEATGSPRRIFKFRGPNGSFQYVSLDLAHGMFEFHDSNGNHLGEYHFDGSKNADADVTHNLRTL